MVFFVATFVEIEAALAVLNMLEVSVQTWNTVAKIFDVKPLGVITNCFVRFFRGRTLMAQFRQHLRSNSPFAF